MMRQTTRGSTHLRQAVKVVINYRGQRRRVLREEFFELARRMSPVLAIDSGTEQYLVSTRDQGISRMVFAHGSYEHEVMEHAFALAGTYVGRPELLAGRTFVDIGANIGTSTIPALIQFGAAGAVSIEADAENHKLLRCNLIVNGVDDRVRTVRSALSDRTGTGVLERDTDNWGDHRVRASGDVEDGLFGESARPTSTVPMTRFDDVARDLPIDLDRVGIVKMDVQGHEGHVLAGATSLLDRDIPVAIEYWPYGLRRADGLTLLHDLVSEAYKTVVDVRASLAGTAPVRLPASEISTLTERYPGHTYTDLLLLK